MKTLILGVFKRVEERAFGLNALSFSDAFLG
jgi:hypothetical protein